jgi:hypothetical protein
MRRSWLKLSSLLALFAGMFEVATAKLSFGFTSQPTIVSQPAVSTPLRRTPPTASTSRQILSRQAIALEFHVPSFNPLNGRLSRTLTRTFNSLLPVPPVEIDLPKSRGIDDAALFRGDSKSLVAKAVGSAEGTRQPNGGTNPAYYGHIDPGNAAWNVGTFSYQHCSTCSPQEADRRQLRRLRWQFQQIRQQAQRQGLQLSLEEQLNAIDLANQSPIAALASGGFIDRLRWTRQQGWQGSEAVLQARVFSYQNPYTQLWDAPGLGNTESGIRRDQSRRQAAIAAAIQAHR